MPRSNRPRRAASEKLGQASRKHATGPVPSGTRARPVRDRSVESAPTASGWSAPMTPSGLKRPISARVAQQRSSCVWSTSVVWAEDHRSARPRGLSERRHWHPTAGRHARTATALLVMTFDPASFVFSQPSETTAIRASTVLPARRENVELQTEDGHVLVGELALPESGDVAATLITLHPLLTHGGFMIRTCTARPRTGCPPSPAWPSSGSTPGGPVPPRHERRPLRRGYRRTARR